MKIGEGLVLGTALTAAVAITAGCSAEQPAAPTPTPSPEATVTSSPEITAVPTPTSVEQCTFGIGGVALIDKATKTFKITSLYAGKVAPDDICAPRPGSEAEITDLHHVFSPEEKTNQRVGVGSVVVATCMSVKPSYLGIETKPGHNDAVSFYPGAGLDTEITAALGARLPDCFDVTTSAPQTK